MPNTNAVAARQQKQRELLNQAKVTSLGEEEEKPKNVKKKEVQKNHPPVTPIRRQRITGEKKDEEYYLAKFSKKPSLDHVNQISSTVDLARSQQHHMKKIIMENHIQRMNRGKQIREVIDVPKNMQIQHIQFAPSVMTQVKKRLEEKKNKTKKIEPLSPLIQDNDDMGEE